jgi:hypothetical protein
VKPSEPDAARLLRWYPRGWRERYGEEFLAMVEDSLDGGRPRWRLRLSVAWAGRPPGQAAAAVRTRAGRMTTGWPEYRGSSCCCYLCQSSFALPPATETSLLQARLALSLRDPG